MSNIKEKIQEIIESCCVSTNFSDSRTIYTTDALEKALYFLSSNNIPHSYTRENIDSFKDITDIITLCWVEDSKEPYLCWFEYGKKSKNKVNQMDNQIVITIDNCRHCSYAELSIDESMCCSAVDINNKLRTGWGSVSIPDWCPYLNKNFTTKDKEE